jgi:UDP-glucose 4-epimerase
MIERMLADFETAHGLRSMILRYFNAAGADPTRARARLGWWRWPYDRRGEIVGTLSCCLN